MCKENILKFWKTQQQKSQGSAMLSSGSAGEEVKASHMLSLNCTTSHMSCSVLLCGWTSKPNVNLILKIFIIIFQ